MNIEKMRELADVIEANEHRVDMRHWTSGWVNPAAKSWKECGTTFCAAGWQAVLDGYRPETYGQRYPDECYGNCESSGDFYLPGPGGEYRPDTVDGAFGIAQRSLDLTEREAWALFHATEIATAEEFRELIEYMIQMYQRGIRKVTV